MKIDCSHKLESYKGKCFNLHGHTYNVFVLKNFPVKLPENNMIVDFKKLKEEKTLTRVHEEIENAFDHSHLNQTLNTKDPTAEYMAKRIYDKFLRDKFTGDYAVMVMETDNSVAIYDGITFWLSASKK